MCGSTLNHAINIVGYNQTNSYYIVRNSWGTTWGMSGYGYFAFADGNGTCGINSKVIWYNMRA